MHGFIYWRGLFQHRIGDARIVLNKTVDALSGIHQTLKAIHNLVVLDKDSSNLDSPIPIVRGKTGRLKVQNYNTVITQISPRNQSEWP
jgi:hypothetical protein